MVEVNTSGTLSPRLLPDFGRPPVVEVVAGIQFEPQECLRPFETAALRDLWREAYPLVQEQPPLPPTIETYPGGEPAFQVFVGPPPTRLWFLTGDLDSLVQLQPDQLHVNWRAMDEGNRYPRWDWVRDRFEARVREVFRFVQERTDREPAIRQVEVTYINAIELDDGTPAGLDRLFAQWSTVSSQHYLGVPRQFKATLVFDIDGMGRPPVRLYVDAGPGTRPSGVPSSFLTLTVRGAPLKETVDSALQFAEEAHEHIVRSFAELTPPIMHTQWDRRR